MKHPLSLMNEANRKGDVVKYKINGVEKEAVFFFKENSDDIDYVYDELKVMLDSIKEDYLKACDVHERYNNELFELEYGD